jgi:hypothetical protein
MLEGGCRLDDITADILYETRKYARALQREEQNLCHRNITF